MHVGSVYEIVENQLRPPSRRALKSDYHDVIDHVAHDGDVLAVVRWKGCRSDSGGPGLPTAYSVCRLVPIDDIDSASFDNPLYAFPRARRTGFHGHYRVDEIFIRIEPGRHRGMVRELVGLMKRHVTKPVAWKRIQTLDGIRIRP